MGRGSLPREVSLFPKQELLPEHKKDQYTYLQEILDDPRLQQPSNSLLTMGWVGWCSVRLLTISKRLLAYACPQTKTINLFYIDYNRLEVNS